MKAGSSNGAITDSLTTQKAAFLGGPSQPVYALSVAQHCPLLLKEGTMAKRYAVSLSTVSACEEHGVDTIKQARAPGAVKLTIGGQQPSSRACYLLFCARRKRRITATALQQCACFCFFAQHQAAQWMKS